MKRAGEVLVALMLAVLASSTMVSAVCSDSDSGKNLTAKGTASGADAYGGNISVNATYTDLCQGETRVLEFFCEGSGEQASVNAVNESCASGEQCLQGACSIAVSVTNAANTANTTNKTTTPAKGNFSANQTSPTSAEEFPDPLSEESKDFFSEFTLEDFFSPGKRAEPQPELPSPRAPQIGEAPVNVTPEVVQPPVPAEEEELEPAVNKLLLNVTVNMSSVPPRLIGYSTFVDTSLLFPQFLPSVKPDAGLYATCMMPYPNASSSSQTYLRGSSIVLYVSALSPSLKCPKAKDVELELAYRLTNLGLAEIYPDGQTHSCTAPWFSPSTGRMGSSVVKTPFVVSRVLVPIGAADRQMKGKIIVPVRQGQATAFNHFQYTAPRAVYIEAFRGASGQHLGIELTMVRCKEGKPLPALPSANGKQGALQVEQQRAPSFFVRLRCLLSALFGRDYEGCVYARSR